MERTTSIILLALAAVAVATPRYVLQPQPEVFRYEYDAPLPLRLLVAPPPLAAVGSEAPFGLGADEDFNADTVLVPQSKLASTPTSIATSLARFQLIADNLEKSSRDLMVQVDANFQRTVENPEAAAGDASVKAGSNAGIGGTFSCALEQLSNATEISGYLMSISKDVRGVIHNVRAGVSSCDRKVPPSDWSSRWLCKFRVLIHSWDQVGDLRTVGERFLEKLNNIVNNFNVCRQSGGEVPSPNSSATPPPMTDAHQAEPAEPAEPLTGAQMGVEKNATKLALPDGYLGVAK